jgi:hypothetical protein
MEKMNASTAHAFSLIRQALHNTKTAPLDERRILNFRDIIPAKYQ